MDQLRIITYDKDFHDIVSNKEVLQKTTEKFLNNIIDDITLGIIFDVHRKYKTKAYCLKRDKSPPNEEILPHADIFGQYNIKLTQECDCPKCDRTVAAIKFASHLADCMGTGRRSRIGGRRNNNSNNNNVSKDRSESSFSGVPSDDEDDADWSSDEKRRKKKHRNGTKKGKGTPKKNNSDYEILEGVVDIEGDDEENKFREDNSNQSSPAESASTSTNNSNSSSKKKNKSKSKKK